VPGPEESTEAEAVHIAASDPSWPAKFEAERAALQECIAPWVVGGIHHLGSTSVPGLPAKPVIDILAEVGSLDRSRPCIATRPSRRVGSKVAAATHTAALTA
jgi:GrpB-like predicted nucleotidyltransferase (UPF0157 family)